MEREKKNSSLWPMLALAFLLCFGIFVASTGTAFGRYKTNNEGTIVFEMRKPAEIYLGKISGTEDGKEYFVPFSNGETPEWVSDGSISTLEFAVSNGTMTDESIMKTNEFSEEDLRFRIRLISDLGLTEGAETNDSAEIVSIPAEVTVTMTPKGSDEGTEKTAFAERILSGSTLFFRKGEGWIYSLRDENGNEIGWDLKGGEISYVKIKIKVDTSKINAAALNMEPQIIVEKAE